MVDLPDKILPKCPECDNTEFTAVGDTKNPHTIATCTSCGAERSVNDLQAIAKNEAQKLGNAALHEKLLNTVGKHFKITKK